MRPTRRALGALLCAVALATGACSADSQDDPGAAAGSTTPTPTQSATPEPLPTATPAPTPRVRACYRLDYEAALAPTAEGAPVDCAQRHSAVTVGVGPLDDLLAGHLVAVDSRRVREAVAQTCPRIFTRFVGGSAPDQRLSMLRPVWFTPTLEESGAGAQWFRCDAIAVAGDDRLAPLTGRLEGALGDPERRERYAMCGTAAPDAADFERVICSGPHSWRAISIVDFPPGDYPGVDDARQRGQAPCEDAGADVADDSLSFEWGYEWPTKAQWEQGQTFGRCWAPD